MSPLDMTNNIFKLNISKTVSITCDIVERANTRISETFELMKFQIFCLSKSLRSMLYHILCIKSKLNLKIRKLYQSKEHEDYGARAWDDHTISLTS